MPIWRDLDIPTMMLTLSEIKIRQIMFLMVLFRALFDSNVENNIDYYKKSFYLSMFNNDPYGFLNQLWSTTPSQKWLSFSFGIILWKIKIITRGVPISFILPQIRASFWFCISRSPTHSSSDVTIAGPIPKRVFRDKASEVEH